MFQNIHSNLSYKRTPIKANGFDKGM